jgi:hypothetical protein
VRCGTAQLVVLQGLSITGAAMATMELARVDASCATFYLVHTFLAMLTVALMVRGGGVQEGWQGEGGPCTAVPCSHAQAA